MGLQAVPVELVEKLLKGTREHQEALRPRVELMEALTEPLGQWSGRHEWR